MSRLRAQRSIVTYAVLDHRVFNGATVIESSESEGLNTPPFV
jgi:hypothetical protein